jgi:hypothetical protein
MARRVLEQMVHQMGKLELPWGLEAGQVDPVFEVTAAAVRVLAEQLAEPDCSASLAELEAALSGVRQAATLAAR